MTSPRPRGVFFDLGGTLFSYRELFRATRNRITSAAERLGVTATRREVGRAYASASQAVTHQYAGRAFYLHRDLFRDIFRRFAENLGVEASDAYLDWFEADLRDSSIDQLVLRDDCLATLGALKRRGLYLSIVSNIDDDHLFPMVERTGLDQVLDHWTSSEEARSCKPDPRFFELAMAKAGLPAEAVLFVGDSPEHDVRGARGVGMRTALIVEDGSPPPLQTGRGRATPDYEIRALRELLRIVG